MTFLNLQYWPYLLLAFALLLLAVIWNWRQARLVFKTFCAKGMSNVSVSLRRVRYLILTVALILLGICALRPIDGYEKIEQQAMSRSVIFLLDISNSMNVADIREQSRLDYSKWWIKRLCELQESERYGLISFSGIAHIECPLSSDSNTLFQQLESLNTGMLPGGGSNIAKALELAAKQFKEDELDSRTLVLLTDGETLHPEWKEQVDALKAKNISVQVLGLGDPSKVSVVEDSKGKVLRKRDGELVTSQVKPEVMREIAEATGGLYFFNQLDSPSATGHREIIARIKRLESKLADDPSLVSVPKERFYYFLPWAIVLLILYMLLGETRRRDMNKSLFQKASLLLLSAHLTLMNPEAFAEENLNAKPAIEVLNEKDLSVDKVVEKEAKIDEEKKSPIERLREVQKALASLEKTQDKKQWQEQYQQVQSLMDMEENKQIKAYAETNLAVAKHRIATAMIQQDPSKAVTELTSIVELYKKQIQNNYSETLAKNYSVALRDLTIAQQVKKQAEEKKKRQEEMAKKIDEAAKKQEEAKQKEEEAQSEQNQQKKQDLQKQAQEKRQEAQQKRQEAQQDLEKEMKEQEGQGQKQQQEAKKNLEEAAKKQEQAQQGKSGEDRKKADQEAIDALRKAQKALEQGDKKGEDGEKGEDGKEGEKGEDGKEDPKEGEGDKQDSKDSEGDKGEGQGEASLAKMRQAARKKSDQAQAKSILLQMMKEEKKMQKELNESRQRQIQSQQPINAEENK